MPLADDDVQVLEQVFKDPTVAQMSPELRRRYFREAVLPTMSADQQPLLGADDETLDAYIEYLKPDFEQPNVGDYIGNAFQQEGQALQQAPADPLGYLGDTVQQLGKGALQGLEYTAGALEQINPLTYTVQPIANALMGFTPERQQAVQQRDQQNLSQQRDYGLQRPVTNFLGQAIGDPANYLPFGQGVAAAGRGALAQLGKISALSGLANALTTQGGVQERLTGGAVGAVMPYAGYGIGKAFNKAGRAIDNAIPEPQLDWPRLSSPDGDILRIQQGILRQAQPAPPPSTWLPPNAPTGAVRNAEAAAQPLLRGEQLRNEITTLRAGVKNTIDADVADKRQFATLLKSADGVGDLKARKSAYTQVAKQLRRKIEKAPDDTLAQQRLALVEKRVQVLSNNQKLASIAQSNVAKRKPFDYKEPKAQKQKPTMTAKEGGQLLKEVYVGDHMVTMDAESAYEVLDMLGYPRAQLKRVTGSDISRFGQVKIYVVKLGRKLGTQKVGENETLGGLISRLERRYPNANVASELGGRLVQNPNALKLVKDRVSEILKEGEAIPDNLMNALERAGMDEVSLREAQLAKPYEALEREQFKAYAEMDSAKTQDALDDAFSGFVKKWTDASEELADDQPHLQQVLDDMEAHYELNSTILKEAATPDNRPFKPVAEAKDYVKKPEIAGAKNKIIEAKAELKALKQGRTKEGLKATETPSTKPSPIKKPEAPKKFEAPKLKRVDPQEKQLADIAKQKAKIEAPQKRLDQVKAKLDEVKAKFDKLDNKTGLTKDELRQKLALKQQIKALEPEVAKAQAKVAEKPKPALDQPKADPRVQEVAKTEYDPKTRIGTQNEPTGSQKTLDQVSSLIPARQAKMTTHAKTFEKAMQQGKAVEVKYHRNIRGSGNTGVAVGKKGDVGVETSIFTPTHFYEARHFRQYTPLNAPAYTTEKPQIMVAGYNQLGQTRTYHLNELAINGKMTKPVGDYSRMEAVKIVDQKPFVGTTANVYRGAGQYNIDDVLNVPANATDVMKTADQIRVFETAKGLTDAVQASNLPKEAKAIFQRIMDKKAANPAEIKTLQNSIAKLSKAEQATLCTLLGI